MGRGTVVGGVNQGAIIPDVRFSLLFFSAEDAAPGGTYRLLLEGAKFADRHGFDAVWTPERHFQRFGGPYPNPAVTGAALAVLTQSIRIRAGAVVLPLHDPVRLAENFAVVDNLSAGRVEMACVVGSHPDDYALRPDAYASKDELLREGVETIRRLWRGERIAARNGLGQPIDIEIFPRPVQPELDVWRVCNREPSCRKAGEDGVKILSSMLYDTLEGTKRKVAAYREGLAAAGREGHLALMVHAFVGDRARELSWPAYRQYLQTNMALQRRAQEAAGREVPVLSDDDQQFMFENAFDRLKTTHGLIGTVEQCVPMVEAYREMGVDEIACLIDFGVDADEVLASLDHLNRLREICG